MFRFISRKNRIGKEKRQEICFRLKNKGILKNRKLRILRSRKKQFLEGAEDEQRKTDTKKKPRDSQVTASIKVSGAAASRSSIRGMGGAAGPQKGKLW